MERVKYENQFFAQGQWKDIDTTCWDEKGEAGLVRKKKNQEFNFGRIKLRGLSDTQLEIPWRY